MTQAIVSVLGTTVEQWDGHEAAWNLPITIEEIKKCHNQWLDGKFFEHLPTDGIVVKVNSRSIQKQLGQSTKCPNWAFALKG